MSSYQSGASAGATASYSALMSAARDAFTHGDVGASVAAHARKAQAAKGKGQHRDDTPSPKGVGQSPGQGDLTHGSNHGSNGGDGERDVVGVVSRATEVHGNPGAEFIKSIVFGALDGIITEFAIVASVAGAGLAIQVVIVTGVAKLLGDGLAMGIGDAMSESAEHAYVRSERRKEEAEFSGASDHAGVIELYEDKGFTTDEARRILEIFTRKPEYRSYMLDHVLFQRSGLVMPDESDNPVKNGAVTFVAFMLAGFVPLLSYIVFWAANYGDGKGQLGICSAVTLLTLFALGAVQAYLIKQSLFKQGFLMMVNGGLAAASAYLIGWGLQLVLDVKGC